MLDFYSGLNRQNKLTVRHGGTAGHYVVADTRDANQPKQGSFLDAGTGCTQLTADSVDCRPPQSVAIALFYANLEDGDDEFTNVDVTNISVDVQALEGNDVLRGSDGPDYLEGDGGRDELYGGGGPDKLNASEAFNEPDGVIDCGPGVDEVILTPFDFDAHTDTNCETRTLQG